MTYKWECQFIDYGIKNQIVQWDLGQKFSPFHTTTAPNDDGKPCQFLITSYNYVLIKLKKKATTTNLTYVTNKEICIRFGGCGRLPFTTKSWNKIKSSIYLTDVKRNKY